MIILFSITVLLVIVSFLFNVKKTVKGMKIAVKRFGKILIPLLIMLVLVSVILYLIPEQVITEYLSDGNRYSNTLLASIIGSITMLPGFIAFPLSGILKDKHVTYMVISAFTTTLMMVGILTFPIEKEYFGVKVALLRNIMSFVIALVVAVITGILFGELL
ncbi:MAG: permease [Spirochaetales bacterium]|nr:permease [Spirochaetales bacterium]